uniref:Uncharacterized protein n=1 Tax=Parascaris equorum TaxID=6256 RepID=A0A914RGF7_PAREQ
MIVQCNETQLLRLALVSVLRSHERGRYNCSLTLEFSDCIIHKEAQENFCIY